MLTPAQALAMALDPALILRIQGIEPDTWQRNLLLSAERQVLLLCSRAAGKSRTTSALALHTALFRPKSLVLLLSRAQRQSMELFRYVKEAYNPVGRPVGLSIQHKREAASTGAQGHGFLSPYLPPRHGTLVPYRNPTFPGQGAVTNHNRITPYPPACPALPRPSRIAPRPRRRGDPDRCRPLAGSASTGNPRHAFISPPETLRNVQGPEKPVPSRT